MTVTISGTTGIAGVDGSAATPAVQGVDTNTGVFYGTDIVAVSTGGTERMRINASGQAEFTAGTAALPAITSTGDTNTGVFFPAADTIAFGEGGAEAMRIDSSGNVGIGTTAASSYGRLAVMTPTSNFGFFGIANSVASGGGVNIAQYYGTVKISYIDSTLENGTPGAETARLTFATSTAGTLTERMRIDSSGNVLIQETTSYARFTVTHAGATEFAITTNNTNTGGASQTSVGFRRNGAFVGTITTTASATAYNTSSDYRLKEDLQPMANVIDRVLALKPVNFAWKIDSSRVDGFLAHEAQDVVPECVTGTKDAMRDEEYEITAVIEATYDDEGNELTAVVPAVMGTRSVPDYQGIDQSKLVPLLTAAIQEQQAMITALTNRITALEATP